MRFLTLDALRGVAAYAVFAFHGLGGTVLPSAGLAVDFFFMLSGFVIAHAYEARLKDGLGAGDFMIRRLIRLYPVTLVGTALGLAVALAHNLANPAAAYSLPGIVRALASSLTLLPDLGPPSERPVGPEAWPLNPVYWSLFFELTANAAYAVLAKRLTDRRLLVICLACLAVLAARGWPGGGNMPATILVGFARVGFGFFAGVLLYRHRSERLRAGPVLLAVALLLAFCLPRRSLLGVGAIAVVLPVLVLAGANHAARWPWLCRVLGDLSYPVYCIHLPVLYVVTGLFKRVGPVSYPLVLLTAIAATTLLGSLVLRVYDQPVRAALTRLQKRRPESSS